MIKKLYTQQKMDTVSIINNYPKAHKILFFLLGIDLIFVLLHFYSLSLPMSDATRNLRLDMDFGYAEMFQYIKFICVATLLAVMFFKRKLWIYVIWSLFFLFLFADDAFSFHEAVGGDIAEIFNLQGVMGLRSRDLGELVFVGLIGLSFMFFFLFALIRGSKKTKQITIHFILLMGVLVFFGVGIDMLHSVLIKMPGSGILTIIEDWGEMLATSLILWYSVYLFLEQKKYSKN